MNMHCSNCLKSEITSCLITVGVCVNTEHQLLRVFLESFLAIGNYEKLNLNLNDLSMMVHFSPHNCVKCFQRPFQGSI